jgi:hypothetical protein
MKNTIDSTKKSTISSRSGSSKVKHTKEVWSKINTISTPSKKVSPVSSVQSKVKHTKEVWSKINTISTPSKKVSPVSSVQSKVKHTKDAWIKTNTILKKTYIPPDIIKSSITSPYTGVKKKHIPHQWPHISTYEYWSKPRSYTWSFFILFGMIMIVLFGIIKIYLDYLTQHLVQTDISENVLENVIDTSSYIAKEENGTQYNLIGEDDDTLVQIWSDIEAQKWEEILSDLQNNQWAAALVSSGSTGSDTQEAKLIVSLYNGYNTNDKQLIFPNLDTRFKNSQEYLTYFRTTRMKIFVDATEGWLQVSNFKIKPSDNPLFANIVSYQVQYTIQDQTYSEDRDAYLVDFDNQLKIKKLYCVTTNCSKGPFFNFQKFNIN